MKLLIRRNQKSGMISSKVTFTLDARAELTADEAARVKKYRMGDTVIYESAGAEKMAAVGAVWTGAIGYALRRVAKAMQVKVDDVVNGKHFECKDIVEMLAVEEQVKEACQMFKRMLESATHFEGEEVLEV